MRRITRAFGLSLLGAALMAGPIWAGQPQREFVPIDDLFMDEFLSGECGVEVNAHVTGHVIFRPFTDAEGCPRGQQLHQPDPLVERKR
jgi:hypothetical protein